MAKNNPNAGGNWFNAAKKPGAFTLGENKTTEQVETAPVVEKATTETVPSEGTSNRAQTTEQPVAAPKTTETVPTEGKAAAEVVETSVVDKQTTKDNNLSAKPEAKPTEAKPEQKPIAKKVIKAEPSALIEIPGHKPKSAENLAFELRQAQNLQRKANDLDVREQRLREREERLMSGVVEKPAAQTTQATTTDQDDPRPVRPKDSIPGDPEYDEWLVSEIAWQNRQSTKHILMTLTAQQREQMERERAASQTLQANAEAWQDALTEHLPFDYASLDDTAKNEVFERTNAIAQEVLGLDLRIREHVSQSPISRQQFGLLLKAAYPAGTYPAGYAAAEDEDEPVDEAIEQLRETADKPIVQGDKPQPLHDNLASTVAAPPKDARPQPRSPWHASWKQPVSQ